MRILSLLLATMTLASCALRAQGDDIAARSLRLVVPSEARIYADDSTGVLRQYFYVDSTSTLWLGTDATAGTGGDTILAAGGSGLSPIYAALDLVSSDNGNFSPASGDAVSLGTISTPWQTVHATGATLYQPLPILGATLGIESSSGEFTNLRSGATSTYIMTLPSGVPGATECLTMDTGGNVDHSPCALLSVANTWTATQTMQDILARLDSAYDIGASATRFDEGWFDNLHTVDLFFRRQGELSQDFYFANSAANRLDLRNAAGTLLMLVDEVNLLMGFARDLYPLTTADLDLGTTTAIWDNTYTDSLVAYTEVVPDTSGGATLGTDALKFTEANILNTVYIGDAAATTGDITMFNATAATSANISTLDLGVGVTPEIAFNTSILPFTDGVGHIGYSSRRWEKLWVTDIDVSGTCTGCGGGALPVADTTSVVEGSADATKEIRFEVDGLTTGTVRVLTPQNADYTLAGTNIAQTFSATQTFQNIVFATDGTYTLGGVTARPSDIYGYDVLLGRSGAGAGSIQLQNTSGLGYTIAVTTGGDMRIDSDFFPSSGGSLDMGSLAVPWRNATFSGGIVASTYSGTTYRASGVDGTSATLTCGAGEAVKNITVSGGIVTAVSCGAP